MTATRLTPEEASRRCDFALLEGGDAGGGTGPAIVGQARAAAAVEFGVATTQPGYHLFVAGGAGTGRKRLVRSVIAAHVAQRAVQRSDYVYVNNFAQPHKPLALELPAGRGSRLRSDMVELVRDLRTMIGTMFESEEYATEVERIGTELKERAERAFREVSEEAQRRETHLGGPVHAKGVLILSSFLAARYSRLRPHSIAASLVFEQTYGLVEGDSASLAELVALLSSLADVAVEHRFALTGAVDQFGGVQAVGGVNEKIEGFFDLCAARGLDGTHGVVLPRANVAHLMLRDDVVAAIDAGRFSLFSVTSVDEALALLTGMAAGDPVQPGHDTVNGRVTARLREYAKLRAGDLGTVLRRVSARTVQTDGPAP